MPSFFTRFSNSVRGVASSIIEMVRPSLPTPPEPPERVTLAQMQSEVDLITTSLINTQVASAQELFNTGRGRFWQGLETTSRRNLPNNVDADILSKKVAPNIDSRPHDQVETWRNVGILLEAQLPMSVEVNTYDGPSGKGYEVVTRVKHTGKIYKRVRNFGPEDYREAPWEEDFFEEST